MAKKAEVNKQGVFQGSMIEENGNVRIMADDIVIGANLLSGTKEPNDPYILTSTAVDGCNYIIPGTGIIYVTPGKTYTLSAETDGTWTNQHGGTHNPANKDIGMWFYLRIQGTTTSEGSYDSPLFLGTSSTYQFRQEGNKGIWTWTAPSNAYTIRVRHNIYSNGTDSMTVKLWSVKVEEGSIATPWVPNAADAAYSKLGFASVNSNIHDPIKAEDFYEI